MRCIDKKCGRVLMCHDNANRQTSFCVLLQDLLGTPTVTDYKARFVHISYSLLCENILC